MLQSNILIAHRGALFCVETALKLLKFCTLAYVDTEADSIDEGKLNEFMDEVWSLD